MKKLMAILMIFALFVSAACAAEWPEGRSAAQPYAGVPEVDLTQTLGYTMVYPRPKLPAHLYCDALEFYLPREDIKTNEGILTLYSAEGEVLAQVDFADETVAGVRKLNDTELEKLLWGGGVCVYARLPKSLEFGKSYYVMMDEKCFTSEDGGVFSLAISDAEAWTPVLEGDYGVSGLYYSAAPVIPEPEEPEEGEEGDEEETEETPEPTEIPEEEEGEIEYKLQPEKGDRITFDLVLGGDATTAVIFSENDSVWFDTLEYTESSHVVGSITKKDLNWGVVFLTDRGEVVDSLFLGR